MSLLNTLWLHLLTPTDHKVQRITMKEAAFNIYANNFEKRKQEHIKSCLNSKSKNHSCKIYQFIRASGGIDNWNMDILCEFYASFMLVGQGRSKEAREQVEQKYIDELKPTLNMCRATKVITGYAYFYLEASCLLEFAYLLHLSAESAYFYMDIVKVKHT